MPTVQQNAQNNWLQVAELLERASNLGDKGGQLNALFSDVLTIERWHRQRVWRERQSNDEWHAVAHGTLYVCLDVSNNTTTAHKQALRVKFQNSNGKEL